MRDSENNKLWSTSYQMPRYVKKTKVERVGIKLPGMPMTSYCRTLPHWARKTTGVAPRNLTAMKAADARRSLPPLSANRTDQTGLENAWECQPRLQNCPEHGQREASADLLGHGSASHDLMEELLDIDEFVKLLEERQS